MLGIAGMLCAYAVVAATIAGFDAWARRRRSARRRTISAISAADIRAAG